ncbi:MAG: ABC transporter permease [Clostridiaceae bacterium]|nr:ABC transporter permease [Clostridiaceae bacterium]
MRKPLGLSEIKPLSFIKYFHNNVKKSLVIMLALILSIFMIIIFQMVMFAVNEPARIADVEVSNYATKIFEGKSGKIDAGVIKQMQENEKVERFIPTSEQDMDYNHLFGTCNISVFSIRESDIKYVLEKLGLKLREGRMPVVGKNEILLDWRLANNKNKKIGNFIGKEINLQEKLTGKYKIVGILEGKSIIGVIPTWESQELSMNKLLVFPKEGQLEKINEEFSKVTAEKAYFWTKEKAEDNYTKNEKSLKDMFGIMSIAVILVMSFASGNSSYAQYFSRRNEFALLQSIGYTRGQILLRAAKEIALLNLVGLAAGVTLGFVAGLILDRTFFIPNGYPFVLMQSNGMIEALTIPLCTALFGLIPAGWLLSTIDPMTVVEKSE